MGGAGASLPIAGAILGLCVGGPVGLLAGAKLGGVAAISGSILGYTGASIIRYDFTYLGYFLAKVMYQGTKGDEETAGCRGRDKDHQDTIPSNSEGKLIFKSLLIFEDEYGASYSRIAKCFSYKNNNS